jgi:hypothetical protein
LPFHALECFPATSASLAPYFIQTDFGQRPALAYKINELPHFTSPIRYCLDGIESPLSYALKVRNNEAWKGSSRSPFAYTELDIANNALDSQFVYASSVSVVPPASAPSSLYPFAYGVNVPNTAGGVLKSNSPYFVEKFAGLDSVGLLESLLMVVPSGGASIASQTEGLLPGSLFQSRWSFRLSFPGFTQSSYQVAWPQSDYSSTAITIDGCGSSRTRGQFLVPPNFAPATSSWATRGASSQWLWSNRCQPRRACRPRPTCGTG